MKINYQSGNALRHLLHTGLLAAASIAVTSNALAATLAVDLSNTAVSYGTISDGTNSVIFSFDKQQPTGSGVIDSFLRIQQDGNEQGYNTDINNVLDNKDGNFTRNLQFSELVKIGGFYSFILDINESGNNNETLLSLDGLKFFKGSADQFSEDVDGSGNANGITGSLLWNMDNLADNYVLLDYARVGTGSGASDMLLRVPESVFSGVSNTDNIILWSRFGLQDGARSGSGSNAGFEEWAQVLVGSPSTCTDPVYAANNKDECGGGGTGNNIPEPSVLALLGVGLLGAGMSRANKKA